MVDIARQQPHELLMDYSEQNLAVHDPTPDDNHLWREEKRDVETELGEVEPYQLPNFGVVGDLG
jgi:hypothetical protein